MEATTMESTVGKSHPNAVLDNELDSGELHQLKTESVKQPL